MAGTNITLVNTNKVNLLESISQLTVISATNAAAGSTFLLDSTGRANLASANGGTNIQGISLKAVKAGEAVTLLRHGVLDGYDLSAEAYGRIIFLSDTAGSLSNASNTAAVPVGRVIPATGNSVTAAFDKVLQLECPL